METGCIGAFREGLLWWACPQLSPSPLQVEEEPEEEPEEPAEDEEDEGEGEEVKAEDEEDDETVSEGCMCL